MAFDITDINGLDLAPDNYVLMSSGNTLTPELPPSGDQNVFGSTSQPAISDIPRSDGISTSSILSSAKATAESLLGIWNSVNTIEDKAAATKFNRQITTAQNDLTMAKTLGALDLAKYSSSVSSQIEKAKIEYALANEQAKISSAKTGSTSINKPDILTFAIICGILWYFSSGAKGVK